MRPDGSVLTDLGDGLHIFSWPHGFYMIPFVVSSDGVAVIDPVNEHAATSLREAIAEITTAPITQLVYSHDHRDHIVGGGLLAAAPEVYAHELVREQVLRREDSDVLLPDRQLAHGSMVTVGEVLIEARYYGPTHSDSLCPLIIRTSHARHLYFCDVLDPGIAPYRNLPDTDLRGLFAALAELDNEGGFDSIVAAHSPPSFSVEWLSVLRQYFEDLRTVAAREWASSGGQVPLEGEDGIAMTERVRGELCRRVADELRPSYSSLVGFDAWAPQNADRMLSMLITGN